jgi:stage V sporulation protein B
MKKNKFITSTIILLIGGLITKIFGFIIKIIYTNLIGTEGLAIYSIIVPTYSLLVTIAGFGMPSAISKLIAENKIRSKRILSQGIYILMFVNIITMILVIIFSDFIATTLLNAPSVKVLLIGASLAMPNMGLACVLKGYYYGKEKMLPNTISNIVEQTIRILFVIFGLPYFLKQSLIIGILSFLLINIITEGVSIIIFILLLPKKTNLNLKNIKFEPTVASNLLDNSLPLITGKIIGNIGFFFEPIILGNTLKMVGYNSTFFLREYGIYNGYALSILMLPSFFIVALCTALIPEIAKYYSQNNLTMVKRRTKQALIISAIFGICITLIIVIGRNYFLNLIYHTTLGSNYLLALGTFFFLYYLEAPLSSILQALNHAKFVMKTTTVGVFIKLIVMFILTLFKIGLYSLVIAELINILFVVVKNYHKLKKVIRKKELILSSDPY